MISVLSTPTHREKETERGGVEDDGAIHEEAYHENCCLEPLRAHCLANSLILDLWSPELRDRFKSQAVRLY